MIGKFLEFALGHTAVKAEKTFADASEIKEFVQEETEMAKGYWMMTTSHDRNVLKEVNLGMTTLWVFDKDEQKAKLRAQMDNGITYQGKVISDEYAFWLKIEIEDYIDYEEDCFDKTIQQCQWPYDDGTIATHWQWVTETADGTTNVWNNDTFCKYGEDALVPPACPLTACSNYDCSVCADDWISE